MMRLSSQPIHYESEQGEWQEVDLEVVASGEEAFAWQSTKNSFRVYFARSSLAEALVRYQAGEAAIEFGIESHQAWGQLRETQAVVRDSEVVYPGMFQNVDLGYRVLPQQLLEELRVQDRKTASEIVRVEKRFRTENAIYDRKPDGSIEFRNSQTGAILWSIPRPVLYELGNPEIRSYALHFEIAPREGCFSLTKVLEPEAQAWLSDPERRFPVVVDDTVDLNETDMTVDGYVRMQHSSYQRIANLTPNLVGFWGGWVNRGFMEWATSAIPDDIQIQSLGLYAQVAAPYGTGNTLDLVRLSQPVSAYSDQELFDTIGNEGVVYADDVKKLQTWAGTPRRYVNLGYELAGSQSILDLRARLANDEPFGIGVRGSNESSAFCGMVSEDAANATSRPDLVIFYRGIEGDNDKLLRSLRTSFWDGAYYWVFFWNSNPTDPGKDTDYYYSADGISWARSGELAADGVHHISVWHEPGSAQVWAAYVRERPTRNIGVKVGAISGTTISWTAASTPFADRCYDLPTVIRDTNGYCWVMARHYTSQTIGGLWVVRSESPACNTWDSPTILLADKRYMTVDLAGGYIVPLTGGQVYAVFKDLNVDQTSALKGRLFDGSTWGAEEMIDPLVPAGVYQRGMSAVAIGDTVHLAYIDYGGYLMFVSRTGSWGNPIELDAGPVFGPSLSWDTATDSLYAIYATDGGCAASGAVYYRAGISPYGAADWSAASVLAADRWMQWSDIAVEDNLYVLHSNYAANGVVFAVWVEGISGLEFGSVLGP
jgi:hypothetical protein